ncbi:O-antigen/teichoic acid export membrane protein [Azospirillum fermentarium]|uniref:lipopolysaccharide biosynthesis protein n=1 Tax=Azospirillum fermentarium TaxID=1233114 RepID=UPI002227A436|nr:hypothetical protein [Azospirillum fermentarium]MCW2249605.1 O-antigen/teichoic acid export membrane protein [Azospirillum fermentarium]
MMTAIRNRLFQGSFVRNGAVRRLALGVGIQGLTFVIQTLLQFLSVPICLSAWGPVVYGDWLVLMAAGGLLMVADFGMQGHLGNGLRAAWARGEQAAGQRILQAGLGTYALSLSVLLAVLAGSLMLLDVPSLLGVEQLEHPQATLVLLGLSTLLLLPRELTLSVYAARGQFSRQVGDFLVLTSAQQGTVIGVTLAGGSPIQAAAAYGTVSLLVGWGVSLWSLRRRHPDVAFMPCRPAAAELWELAVKSPFYGLQQSGGVLLVQLPVILLGRLSSPGAVVVFSTMRTLTGVIRQFANQFATVAGLEMAHLYARGDVAGTARLHRILCPVAGAVIGTISGVTLAVGPWFLGLWTHGNVAFDRPLAATFVAAAVLMTPAYCAMGLLRLIGRPQPLALAMLLQAAAMILLALILIPDRDALGAAIAVGMAEIMVATPIMLRAASRALSSPILPVLVRTYAAAVVAGGCCLAMAAGIRAAIAG